jgi:hypothetical protein
VKQFPLDALHDFLEKIAPTDGLSILYGLVSEGRFSLSEYNSMLSSLRLEGYESTDRPPQVRLYNSKLFAILNNMKTVTTLQNKLGHLFPDLRDSPLPHFRTCLTPLVNCHPPPPSLFFTRNELFR